MKKILSVFLSLLIIASVCATFSVSAASAYKQFNLNDKTYHNYTYTDEHNYNQFTLTKSGAVTIYPGKYSRISKSTGVKSNESYSIYLYSFDGRYLTQLDSRSVTYDNTENYLLFLDAGTYVVDFDIYYYSTSYTHKLEKFGMTFKESKFDGHTRNASTSVYNSYIRESSGITCYNQVTAKENTRIEVTFNLPVGNDGSRHSTDLILEKKTSTGWTKYASEWYYTGDIPADKSAVATFNVSKGTYRFYFDTVGTYSTIQKYSEVTYVKYKSKVTAASKLSVAKPTLTQTTTYSSNYSTTRKLTVNYNKHYDGVELWVKTNKGKYVKKATSELTSYSNQAATFTLWLDYPNNNKYFYKVRAYTLYGTNKKYSSYSDVRYSRSSGVKQPSVTLKNDSRKITVSYKKLSGVSGYEIYRSTKKSSGFTMVKRTQQVNLPKTRNITLKSEPTKQSMVSEFMVNILQ